MVPEQNPKPYKPFFIGRVVIDNFKQFRHFEVELSEGMNIVVGDNGSGKTTLLEAIDLALTGRFRGEPIGRCLSEYLFNKEVVEEYCSSLKCSIANELPSISIELYFQGGDEHDALPLNGSNNSLHDSRAYGIRFEILFDRESYGMEYATLLPLGKITSLPIEYYTARIRSFADGTITSRSLPLKSAVINPSSELLGFRSESRATRVLYDALEDADCIALAQAYRNALRGYRDNEAVSRVNKALADGSASSGEDISLDVDMGTRDSWKGDLVLTANGIPYSHIGSGMQCQLVSDVAISSSAEKGIGVLLVEEPENHLSHAALNRYLQRLRSSVGNLQLIVSTHSSFVANKLGLKDLILLGDSGNAVRLDDVSDDDARFFSRLSGYDTLRFILCDAAVLVEGPSDELVFQRAFRDANDGLLPIEKGIDVISVGTSFQRYLPIARRLNKRVAVLTDNDNEPNSLVERYAPYKECPNIEVCFDEKEYFAPEDMPKTVSNLKIRWNTLEATLLRENGLARLNSLFGKICDADYKLLKWMESNKTDAALVIFDNETSIACPEYIRRALDFVGRTDG